MRKVLAILILLLIHIQLLFAQHQSTSSISAKEKMQLTEQYFKAAFNADYAVLQTILADDVLFFGPKLSDTLNKVQLIESWLKTHQRNDTMLYLNPKIYLAGESMYDETAADWVFHYYDARFHNADLKKWINFRVHVRFQFKGNKIHRLYVVVNQADIQEQLGYKISAPQK